MPGSMFPVMVAYLHSFSSNRTVEVSLYQVWPFGLLVGSEEAHKVALMLASVRRPHTAPAVFPHAAFTKTSLSFFVLAWQLASFLL
jgi:hypothetical protein